MKIYRDNFKIFLKSKFLMIPFLGASFFCVVYFFYHLIAFDLIARHIQEEVLQFTPIFFILFLFLSYAFFMKMKQADLEECLSVTKLGKGRFILSQSLVLFTLAAAITVLMLLLGLICTAALGVTEGEYLRHLIWLIVLNFLLVAVFAIAFGLVCFLFKKKVLAYFLMAVFTILTTPFMDSVAGAVYLTTERVNLFPIAKIFYIYFKPLHMVHPASTTMVAPSQLAFLAMWALLCLAFLALYFGKKKKAIFRAGAGACLVCCVLLSVYGFQPESLYLERDDPKNGKFTQVWDYMPTDLSKALVQRQEEANFRVTGYNMEFTPKRILDGKVTVTVNDGTLDEYKFTLYHKFEIESVTDAAGTPIPFSRAGDYCKVNPTADSAAFTFTYSGFHPNYYSNSTNINLPGGIPYYPISGFHYLYDIGYQGDIRVRLPEAVPMQVKVNCAKKVYSNLPETGENQFSGASDGLTLASGFYKERDVAGFRVVYPYLDSAADDDAMENLLTPYMEANRDRLAGKAVFFLPVVGGGSGAPNTRRMDLSDHIISYSPAGLIAEGERVDPNYKYTERLKAFYCMVSFYDETSKVAQYYQQLQAGSVSEADARALGNDIDFVMAQKINEFGVDEVDILMHNFAAEGGNYTSALDIVQSIQKEEV